MKLVSSKIQKEALRSARSHVNYPKYINSSRLRGEDDANCNFFKDLNRIVHSSYFRRLQGKTQVWGVQESDFFRTRLTHSLETAQVGRRLAAALKINESLIEALCLAHDLGHPPFAHEGARLLDHFANEQTQGRLRFDDNAQNLRVVVRLASGDGEEGLNPCASMIDGLIKYKRTCTGSCGWYPEEDEVVAWAARICGTGMLRNPLASIVEMADDLAYVCHDLEDAIRADMIRLEDLEQALESLTTPKARLLIEKSIRSTLTQEGKSKAADFLRSKRHQIRHQLLEAMLEEILKLSSCTEFQKRFSDPRYHDNLNPYLIELPYIAELLEVLKQIVLERVINAPNVQTLRFASLRLLESYLSNYWPRLKEPGHPMYRHALLSLPKQWQIKISFSDNPDEKLRHLLDYVAGMSDNYLMSQAAMFYNPASYRAIENRK